MSHWAHLPPRLRRPRLPAATAADGATPAAETSRAALLRGLAAAGALLAASSTLPAAAAASEAAEAAVLAGRGSVAAIAGIASGQQGAAAGLQQLGSGLVWDAQGHIVVPYAPLTRLQRQSTAGNPQVGWWVRDPGAVRCQLCNPIAWEAPVACHSFTQLSHCLTGFYGTHMR